MNRSYDLTFRELELVKQIGIKDTIVLNEIKKIVLSEIQQFYWEESSYPLKRTYYSGIFFCGVPCPLEQFFELRNLLSEKGFTIYKSDEVLTKKFLDFHYFGYQPEKVPSIARECYYLIPKFEKFDFLERIQSECGQNVTVKNIIAKWQIEHNVEIVWFDRTEILLYFKKTPSDIDAFYDEYFQIVGCTFVSEITDEERKQRMKEKFPLLYINFRSR